MEAHECTECIFGSVEFEHECFVGQNALIAVVAHEQEEEVEAEERAKARAGLACKFALSFLVQSYVHVGLLHNVCSVHYLEQYTYTCTCIIKLQNLQFPHT